VEERIGVFLCECGPNIAEKVDLATLAEAAAHMTNVAAVEQHKLLCSADGQKFMAEKIREHGLTRVVVVACSPKQHDQTFMGVCERAGLNPYLLEMANIREQCAWIIEDKEEATEKALRHMRSSVTRVSYDKPLQRREIECNADVLVIGGGIAGMRAASLLASPAREVYIVERGEELGGAVAHYERISPCMASGQGIVRKLVEAVRSNPHIHVLTQSELENVVGFFGNFIATVRCSDQSPIDIRAGAVVVATGFDLLGPDALEAYGYGRIDGVCTSGEFERMNARGGISTENGKTPRSVAILHCVGREEKGYCSAVCCLYSLKFADYLKKKAPGATVTSFFTDLCITGRHGTAFYAGAIEKDKKVELVRCSNLRVEAQDERPAVVWSDETGKQNNRAFDMVVLSPAMIPARGMDRVADMLGLSVGKTGFPNEEHEKLAPVSTSLEGIYVAGCAQGPKTVEETVTQSEAVAGNILSSLIPGRVLETEAKTSHISEALCRGCKTCLNVCTYSAITYDHLKGVCVVNEVLCKGCGNCAAACPSGAAQVRHFTHRQLARELEEILK
jgi:heterodisulfide reductase subunit A